MCSFLCGLRPGIHSCESMLITFVFCPEDDISSFSPCLPYPKFFYSPFLYFFLRLQGDQINTFLWDGFWFMDWIPPYLLCHYFMCLLGHISLKGSQLGNTTAVFSTQTACIAPFGNMTVSWRKNVPTQFQLGISILYNNSLRCLQQ